MTNIGPGKTGVVESDTSPVLYILMRTDLASMNAGKGHAQASHASNAFWKHVSDKYLNHSADVDVLFGEEIEDLVNQWRFETPQGFGTVLVLGVNEIEMRTAVDVADKVGYVSGVVHDPTYPLVDGDFCHFIPLDTCGYIFGDKNDPLLGAVVGNFNLHP
ncbi:hypothetical protein LCGC14_2519310 [marine sediment metagenome]|uniref:peptidyl-tRNA hydrolase n=1 Tax=marine sediment metagenome TaxID=412755 RepID=A0A0F9AX88_9ZZZZ